jgi:predicted DNA-binding protein
MTTEPINVYNSFVGFRTSDDLNARLQRFSTVLGRRKSDIIRYLLVSCLNAYETDREAIAKIRQELY